MSYYYDGKEMVAKIFIGRQGSFTRYRPPGQGTTSFVTLYILY